LNKKGLIGSIISGFVVILVGVTLIPLVTQQLNSLTFCNQTNVSINTTIPEANTGATNSFGGGGTEHFGGYDGKVVHSDWMNKVGGYSITNKSIAGCIPNTLNTGFSKTLLNLIPIIFALAILLVGIAIAWSSFRTVGML